MFTSSISSLAHKIEPRIVLFRQISFFEHMANTFVDFSMIYSEIKPL